MKINHSLRAKLLVVVCLSSWFALAAMTGLTGCVPIPVIPIQSHATRTNLTELTPQQFAPGQSTVEDVVLALGEPDAVSADEQRMAYHSEKTLPVALVVPLMGGTGLHRHRICVFEFDAQGGLLQATQETSTKGDGVNPPNELSMSGEAGRETGQIPAWLAGERPYEDSLDSTWYAGMNGIKDVEHHGYPGLMKTGRLLLTESNLYFFSEAQLANTDPVLKLPLASVNSARIDKAFLQCMLVVQAKPDQVHSFVFPKPGPEVFTWSPATMQSACDFIQSKIKPPRPHHEIR